MGQISAEAELTKGECTMQKVTISVPLDYTTAAALMLQAMKQETTIEEIIERLAVDYVHEIGFDKHVEPTDLVTEAAIIPFEESDDPFAELNLPPRHMKLLRRTFRNIEELLTFENDPAGPNGIRGMGWKTAADIARALVAAGHDIEATVWEAYLPKARTPRSEDPRFAELGLSVRAYNLLCRNFKTIEDALYYQADPVVTILNMTIQTANNIAVALKLKGYEVEGTVWEEYLTLPKGSKKLEPPKEELSFLDLGLSVRACNVLENNFLTIEDVIRFRDNPLSIKGMGMKCADEIASSLRDHGYDLKGTVWEKHLY